MGVSWRPHLQTRGGHTGVVATEAAAPQILAPGDTPTSSARGHRRRSPPQLPRGPRQLVVAPSGASSRASPRAPQTRRQVPRSHALSGEEHLLPELQKLQVRCFHSHVAAALRAGPPEKEATVHGKGQEGAEPDASPELSMALGDDGQ